MPLWHLCGVPIDASFCSCLSGAFTDCSERHSCLVSIMPLWRLYGLLRAARFLLACPQGISRSRVHRESSALYHHRESSPLYQLWGAAFFLCFFLSPGNMKRTSRQAVARNSKRGKAKSAYLREGCKRCLPVWRDVCDRTAAGHLPSAMLGCGRRRQQVE